ncbi:MAG: Rrf2 family transcriptional regulator [Gammaproteobacteria bacterium]|nr:MAG: Rrf2 family transcriptional regulator [Gammaproteobacteria bacterium]
MKLSTKGVYGLRALINLASAEKSPVLLKNIAKEENISEKYLEAIFSSLRKASLIDATRGKNGGYTLATTPDQIQLDRIIDALEGINRFSAQKNIPKNSTILTVMQNLDNKVNEHLTEITLADMLGDKKAVNFSI